MFRIILLFAGTTVTCEWVEISQTYHAPTRLKHNNERVTETLLYRNQALAPWTKGTVNKVSNIGNVIKVPHASVRTPSRPFHDDIETLEPYNFQLKHLEDKNRYVNTTRNENPEASVSNTEEYEHVSTSKIPHYAPVAEKTTKRSRVKSNTNTGIRRIYIEQINKTPLRPSSDSPDITLHSTTEILPVDKDAFELYSEQERNKNVLNKTQNKHSQAQKNDIREDPAIVYINIYNIEGQDTKMDGIWRAVKVVAETIAKHSRKNLNGKLKYLKDLKETIIYSIEDQIDRVWPDDSRRSARSADHHVEIPSSESALMTISFLTFAVFLIKLVLQVIHTYKHKAMMVSPTVLAAVGRAATAWKRKHH